MRIERVELRRIRTPMRFRFETSFGEETQKETILVSVHADGLAGYGESTAMSRPVYNEETTSTVWYVLERFLIPLLFSREISHPDEVSELFAPIRRHFMAKAALEGAVWDLWAKRQGIPLARALGGEKTAIDVGVSIGIEPTVEQVLRHVDRFLSEGYKKIKVKIKPGFDVKVIESIRKEFGDGVPLMADANSAYTLEHIDVMKELDQYGLIMIEQPLAHDDIIDHAKLQRELTTPICLDESIHTVEDARKALELESCRIINIKVGRVGGLTPARKIHDLCLERGIPVWCGGMLEMGVGRAHNIAVTSLPGFTIPGDTSASSRYFERDITIPAIELSAPGTLAIPDGPGIGYDLDEERVRRITVDHAVFRRPH
ncbi:o-succinylbenzoate synthase [Staphylospora marina]|uniref:o-succinylbenzoate synthase n=1 Tax=Staphylospora marina TaxID=2490858 RepID=UPI000F5B9968|nr:o-succinylbenzoate synthase [Staphylospora marina]